MKIEQVKELDPYDQFLYWITEREAIRKKKEANKPKPWTDDEILQSYRFCNVRRMDDTVSMWLYDNWYEPNYNDENMLIACALGRLFNQPSTLKVLGFPHHWNDSVADMSKEVLHTMKDRGERIFNAAYIVSTNGLRMDKIDYVFDRVLQPIALNSLDYGMDDIIDRSSVKNTVKNLCGFNGISSFMAGQITADLRWAVDGGWEDAKTWAAKGPGSSRGMNRLMERPTIASLSQKNFERSLTSLITVCRMKLPKGIMRRLEAIDIQNCLCEYDKYIRALKEEGRPKRKYPGRAQA